MKPRLLVVGFRPFPGIPRNPSAQAARRLATHPRLRRVLGGGIRLLVMRTAYAAIADALEPALAENPGAVLMIGVATRRRGIHVETRARNRVSRLFPDATGCVSAKLALADQGPAERRSRHAGHALLILRRAGVAARLSRDAGRYLCNATYFRALADDRPTLFIHIPLPVPPDRPRSGRARARLGAPERQVDALARVALRLASG